PPVHAAWPAPPGGARVPSGRRRKSRGRPPARLRRSTGGGCSNLVGLCCASGSRQGSPIWVRQVWRPPLAPFSAPPLASAAPPNSRIVPLPHSRPDEGHLRVADAVCNDFFACP